MIINQYAMVGMILLLVIGVVLLAAAVWHPPLKEIKVPHQWSNFRFGYVVYALIFLSFDMEMIYMYPWAVVFADIGVKAFLDMLVFIGLLSAGIAYAWGMGGLKWE